MCAFVHGFVLLLVSSFDRLNRHFCRAEYIQGFNTGIYFADDDDAGLGNFLAVLAIVNGYVVRGRPISQVSNLVSVRSLSFVRDGARQMSKFFSAEQIAHREREWQQRNKVTSCLAVVQRGGDYLIVDF